MIRCSRTEKCCRWNRSCTLHRRRVQTLWFPCIISYEGSWSWRAMWKGAICHQISCHDYDTHTHTRQVGGTIHFWESPFPITFFVLLLLIFPRTGILWKVEMAFHAWCNKLLSAAFQVHWTSCTRPDDLKALKEPKGSRHGTMDTAYDENRSCLIKPLWNGDANYIRSYDSVHSNWDTGFKIHCLDITTPWEKRVCSFNEKH